MSFFEDLIALEIADQIVDHLEEKHHQARSEREQQRHDSLYWQEAARRKNPYRKDDKEDKW